MQHISIQRLSWLGHVVRVEEDAVARRVFDAGSAEVGEEDELASIGKTKSRKPLLLASY